MQLSDNAIGIAIGIAGAELLRLLRQESGSCVVVLTNGDSKVKRFTMSVTEQELVEDLGAFLYARLPYDSDACVRKAEFLVQSLAALDNYQKGE